jgi:carbon storage regulator CsrA
MAGTDDEANITPIHGRRCLILVLTRRLNERIYIGDSIIITIVRIEGGQVRLGVDAPKEVKVLREELIEKPREQEGDDREDGEDNDDDEDGDCGTEGRAERR